LRRTCRRARWRAWIGRYVIAALVLPSLGPLPWLLAGVAVDAHAAVAHHALDHDHTGHGHGDHGNPFDVPGSPTHPADHDCFACQVLAQLGRCCTLPAPAVLAPRDTAAICALLCSEAPVEIPSFFALVPPARAPPPRFA